MSDESRMCCSMAKRLGARLDALDAELRKPEHLGYAKLAAQYGQPASSVERHKKVCLRLGRGSGKPRVRPAPVAGAPVMALDASKNGLCVGLDAQESLGSSGQNIADAGAREPPNIAETRASKVAWILREMILGRWTEENERERVRSMAVCWQMREPTVAEYARSARDARAISAASVAEVKAYSAHWHEAIRDKALEDKTLDLRTAATAQANFDRALGVTADGAKLQISIVNTPEWQRTASTFLDLVDGVHEAVDDLAARAASRLGQDAPRELVAAVLAEAQAMVDERLARAMGRPQIVETTGEDR